jgi:methylglutaconyl-CoA hydratase
MAEFVNQHVSDGVASVSLNRPDVHNAFNEVVIDEITAAFRSANDDAAVRVVVLRSEGKSFSAGADIHWMKRMVDYSFDENVADAATMCHMLRAIRECSKPVIARVHGATFGGGVGLVAACDMAVATSGAVFSLSEVKLGILPAVISPFVIERIGLTHARRYALTAERFDAAVAHRIGLISDVVESADQLDDWIAEMSSTLKGNGPQALAACKRVLSEVGGRDWDASTTLTTRRIAERRVSDEGQEGLKAFLEKRKPAWAG